MMQRGVCCVMFVMVGMAGGLSVVGRRLIRGQGGHASVVRMSTTTRQDLPRGRATGRPPSSWSSKTKSQPTLEGARELVEDALRVARETGARATVRRTVEGQRALLSTLSELRSELPSPPTGVELRDIVDGTRQATIKGESAPAAFVQGVLKWAEKREVSSTLGPRIVRSLFEKLGATYVKLGQFIASSPTLFPAEYVREFEKCLDRAPAVPFEEIRRQVEREAGGSIEEVFDAFDRVPLASASVAQVHAAVYRGRDVVVKVRKPGVEDLLKADLGFVEVAGKALEFVAPDLGRLSIADVLTDLRAVMLDELDFEKEASNLREFGSWLTRSGLDQIAACPEPFEAVSGKTSLVMTRLQGVPITSAQDLTGGVVVSSSSSSSSKRNSEDYLVDALNVWSASVLTCPFFHADVHAGNVLAMDDGRVGFLDFGIVGRVPAEIWDAVATSARAAAARDFPALAAGLADMGAADADVDLAAFATDLEAVFDALANVQPAVLLETDAAQTTVSAQLAFDDAEVTELLIALVNAAEKNGVKLPRQFGLLVKQVLYFDKFTRLLAPDLDVLNDDRISYLRDATVQSDDFDGLSTTTSSSLPPPSS